MVALSARHFQWLVMTSQLSFTFLKSLNSIRKNSSAAGCWFAFGNIFVISLEASQILSFAYYSPCAKRSFVEKCVGEYHWI